MLHDADARATNERRRRRRRDRPSNVNNVPPPPREIRASPDTREQALQLVDIPENLRVLSASPSQGGGLSVRFSDGAEAQYHPGWLRAYAPETQEAPFALPPRQLWTGDRLAALPRFSPEAVDHYPEAFEAYCEALHSLGFAILEGVTPKPGQVERVAQRLGINKLLLIFSQLLFSSLLVQEKELNKN